MTTTSNWKDLPTACFRKSTDKTKPSVRWLSRYRCRERVCSTTTNPWIIAVVLLFCAGYFAVTETAIASASRTKIKTLADRGNARAKRGLYVLDEFDRAISTLLICTNIVHISIATLVTVAVTRTWGLSAVSISTIVTTIAVFFAGEMLPKSIAKKYSERLALATADSLCFFMLIFTPLSYVLTKIGAGAAKLTHGDPEVTVTEDELYDIIENMTDEGEITAIARSRSASA